MVPRRRQLGDPPGPALGRTRRGLARGRLRRARRPARRARPRGVRRALAQGRRPARRSRLPRGVRRVAGVVRRAAHRGRRLRLGQPAPGGSALEGVHELLDHPYAVEQPVAQAVESWAVAQHASVEESTRLGLRVDVVQETHGEPGRGGPRDHRAAAASRPVPRPPGRHDRGRARRRERRGAHGRPDPRRPRPAARPRPRRARHDVPAGRPEPGPRRVPVTST